MDHETPRPPPRYVACVSYPRSGHHVTARVLSAYFGEAFRHCEFHSLRPDECCKRFPCRDPSVTMSKCHDFALCGWLRRGVRPSRSTRCLVLVRSFLDAATSEYEMTRRASPGAPDTAAAWRGFALSRVGYYRRFATKWVFRGAGTRHVMRYEDLTARPLEELADVVRLFDPSTPPDTTRLLACIETASALEVRDGIVVLVPGSGVRDRRDLRAFRWFDPAFFAKIERSLEGVLRELGYAPRFGGHG